MTLNKKILTTEGDFFILSTGNFLGVPFKKFNTLICGGQSSTVVKILQQICKCYLLKALGD